MRTFSRRTASPFSGFALFVAVTLLAPPLLAVDFTGTWSGPFSLVDTCNGTPVVGHGTVTFNLIQTGTAVAGTAAFALQTFGCEDEEPFTLVAGLQATVAENTFSGSVKGPAIGVAHIGAVVEGETLSFGVAAEGAKLGGTATRSSSGPPASTLTGSYSGSYTSMENVTDRCSNMSTLTYTGNLAGNLVQIGNGISGQLVAHGGREVNPDASRNCTVVDSGSESFGI